MYCNLLTECADSINFGACVRGVKGPPGGVSAGDGAGLVRADGVLGAAEAGLLTDADGVPRVNSGRSEILTWRSLFVVACTVLYSLLQVEVVVVGVFIVEGRQTASHALQVLQAARVKGPEDSFCIFRSREKITWNHISF